MDKWDSDAHLKKINVLNYHENKYNDIIFTVVLYLDRRKVAKVRAKFNIDDYNNGVKIMYNMLGYKPGINIDFPTKVYNTLIYLKFEDYMNLPKLSKCSSLLKEIYDTVCESNIQACYITKNDWREMYRYRYNNNDIRKLKEEIKEYGLEDVILINHNDYLIVGLGDLETRFNDDRSIVRIKDSFER